MTFSSFFRFSDSLWPSITNHTKRIVIFQIKTLKEISEFQIRIIYLRNDYN